MYLSIGKGTEPPPSSFASYPEAFKWAYGYYAQKGYAPADALREAKEFADGMAEGLGLPKGPAKSKIEQADELCVKYSGKPLSHWIGEAIPFVTGAAVAGASAIFGAKVAEQHNTEPDNGPNFYSSNEIKEE